MAKRTHYELQRLTAHLTATEVFARAIAYGHTPEIGPTARGDRFHVRCTCGFDSPTTKATKAEAGRQVMVHLRGVVADTLSDRVNGGNVPHFRSVSG